MKHLNNLAIIAVFSFSLYSGINNVIHLPNIGQPEIDSSIISNLEEKKPKSEVQGTNLDESGGWQEIKNETFEGTWPSTGWTVVDLSNDGFDRKWDDDNYKRHGGYWGVWPARGGTDGQDPVPGNDHYFNNMNTRMIYGPFDLSDAVKADVSFWLWREIEICCDYLALEVSTDNVIFHEVYRWTSNNLDWGQWIFSLDGFIGDNSVWISWRFYSDSSIVYDGPWIDDILLRKYLPGHMIPQGTFAYYDRNNNYVSASFMNVYLYDFDPGGTDDELDVTTTDANGFFQFPALINWDVDDNDPDPNNRKLDLYIVWDADYNDSGIAQHRVTNFYDQTYKWYSNIWTNVPDETIDFNYYIPYDYPSLEAMWIFQDLRKAWKYTYDNTYQNIDPGSGTVKWENDENSLFPCTGSCFYGWGPYVFIADNNSISTDTVIHETAHHYMYNSTGWWLWWDISCYAHQLFSQEDASCAWSEGWADYFPLAVNGDPCYDFDLGPCTGSPDIRHYNLETHSRYDLLPFPWGDIVEGRVAGSLYDLYDWNSDGYDSAYFGFYPIADIVFQGSIENSFYIFWDSWKASGQNKHNTVRAMYQNTIDYDTAPAFTPLLPDLYIFENNPPWNHKTDLWNYSIDYESLDSELTYEITYISDWHCGISLDSHWIDLAPQPNWLGTCDATIQISDSLMMNSDTFSVRVVPVVGISYLPIINK